MCQPFDADPEWKEINKADILEFLRKNKSAVRSVPQWIVENDTERINRLSDVWKQWMRAKAPKQAVANIKNKLKRKTISTPASDRKQQLLEEKFQLQNFDLIVWEYVTSNNAL